MFLHLSVHGWGVYTPPGPEVTVAVTEAGGTHPTGMHSC